MRIGVNLGPYLHWATTLAAAKKADEYGFDAIGFLDHYHSEKSEWGYLCGWSLYGALAMVTTHIKLVPMVLCRLNYLPGVLAKETAMLEIISEDRFELGIGAGDFFDEMHAWGIPVPKADERIAGLKETIQVLREIWQGKQVTFEGNIVRVHNALCAPAPARIPPVVIGIGSSRSLLQSALEYADELNVYADEDLIREAHKEIESSGRHIALSTFVWEWRGDIEEKLKEWEQMGVERTFVTFWEPFEELGRATQWMK